MTTYKTCVRVAKIYDLAELGRAASHGRRLDPSAQRRVSSERTCRNLALSPYVADPLDLVGAWHAATQAQGASPYGRAPIAVHVLLIISPACIGSAGDPHDPNNALNVALLREGTTWAEGVFGAGSVIAARLDLDEDGSGVLDVFVVPTRMARMNRATEKMIISVDAPLQALRARYGEEKSYAALQTSWAEHACRHIDGRLRRGTRKSQTGRVHVHADIYRAAAQAAVGLARAEAERTVGAEMTARAQALVVEEARLRARDEELTRTQAELAARRNALYEHYEELRAARDAIDVHARNAATAAIDAVRLGIAAYQDGRIAILGDRSSGSQRIYLSESLSREEENWLKDALAPGLRAGLKPALLALHAAEAGGVAKQQPAPLPFR